MKQGIIKVFKIGGIFTGGIIVGAIIMNLIYMSVRPAYRETIRIDLKTEQEFLASRAARQGNKVRALVHRWNVVDTEANNGFCIFNKERNNEMDSSFFFPFYMLVLKTMMHSEVDKHEKGARISEGIDRGRVALSLESLGAREEADKQWEIARIKTGRDSIEDIRKLIIKLQGLDNSEVYRQAEKAVLGE